MRWLTQLSCFVVLVNSRGAEVREHEPATLSCSDIPNGELLSLSWTKRGPEGGTTIFQHIANQEEGGIRPDMIGHWEKSGQWDIRIQDPTRHDNGTYQCIVVTKDGAKVMDADLLVKVPPTLPIIVEPSNLNMLVGNTARLRCESKDGIPRPEYTWYKDDRKLPKSHRENPSLYTNTTFRLENDPLHDNAITVVFTQVSESDAGRYHCVAKNSAGTATGIPVEITIGKVSAASVIGIIFGVIFGIALLALIVFMVLKKLGGVESNSEYDEDADDANDVMIGENGQYGGVDYGGHSSKSRGHHSLIV